MHKYTITRVLECDLLRDEAGVDDARRVLSLVKDILEKYEHARFEVTEGRIRHH